MRTVCLVLLFAAAAMAQAADSTKEYYDVNDAPNLFEKYVTDYNKEYKDDADRQKHYDAFVETLKNINKWNAEQPNTSYGINQFSDSTPDETSMLGSMVPDQ